MRIVLGVDSHFGLPELKIDRDTEVAKGRSSRISYLQTDRPLSSEDNRNDLKGIYSWDVVSPTRLKGKTVLDIGCGRGRAVIEWRNEGVNAFGVDLYLVPGLRQSPHFFEADAIRLPFADATVDEAFSTLSFLSYEDVSPEYLSLFFNEIRRVLKSGGIFRAGSITPWPSFLKATKQVPELEGLFDGSVLVVRKKL